MSITITASTISIGLVIIYYSLMKLIYIRYGFCHLFAESLPDIYQIAASGGQINQIMEKW
jgi:hypothetical protein